MSKMIAGAAVALELSLPALAAVQKPYPEGAAPALRAEAFPNLTQVYVASGVRDDGRPHREVRRPPSIAATSLHRFSVFSSSSGITMEL